MAYELELFCDFDGSPVKALESLRSSLDLQIHCLKVTEGDGWCSVEWSRPGALDLMLVEFHAQDFLTARELDFASTLPDAPDLSSSNALLIITLSGSNTDWEMLRAIAEHARHLWGGILCDDVSGFSVTLG